MRKDDDLTDLALLRKAMGDFLTMQVVERGNWIVEYIAPWPPRTAVLTSIRPPVS